ncbi:unnamed protein product [Rotaria sp. Silwood1]|nr:unnamed protein product [Rotaria sp. Silwood1]CAF1603509.1 unnamed protein product [Rotaria sp. Silwood1]
MRNKLPLGVLMSTAERMLRDWSISVLEHPFQTHITLDDKIDSKAYEWLQKVDKSQILQLNAFTFVVPPTNAKMNTNTWVSLLYSMDWQTYDQFKDWLNSARILDYS